jgi:hypothetical protein
LRDDARDLADESSLKERAMNPQTDPSLRIKSRIARRMERIAKWEKEADEIETSWPGEPDYRMFCEGMARAAREKKAELEAELIHAQGQ